MSNVIPQSYSEWRHCIEVECGIPLTADFIACRLHVLHRESAEETRRFIGRYGEDHWRRVVSWFEAAGGTE